mgnify:CR=1 FL=1
MIYIWGLGFFYKINEEKKTVIVYAVVDGRQDYLNIIRGL